MNLEEIKQAVRDGHTVCWANRNYEVKRWLEFDGTEAFDIVCLSNDSAIGLTRADGVSVNGKPDQFFIPYDQ